MKFRNIYGHREEEKKGIQFTQPSMTQQRYKDECDINIILSKYRVTGDNSLLGLNSAGEPIKKPQYGDFGDVGTYMEAFEVVMDAQEKFDALPSNVRKAVGNTPQGMLEFINNPDNYERGVELGIFEKNINNDSSSVSTNNGSINNNNADLPINNTDVIINQNANN